MKFTPTSKPPPACEGPRVGDVYKAKGGRGVGYHVIVAQWGESSIFLRVNDEGDITSCGNYYNSCFASRERVGRVEGLDELAFDINWENQ